LFYRPWEPLLSDTNYAVIYDLHSHTIASDGVLTPQELVHRAVAMRVGTLAITDHDTTAAIPAAREEIERAGLALTLIAGVEISTVWENHEIHIVGLNMDIENPALCSFLQDQHERRQQRGRLIAERLEKAHIPGAWEGAQRLAQGLPSRADILPVFWWSAVKPPVWRMYSKGILRAGKPDMFHHSGVQ
jgi:predicted metal-dependent phosphoesterase TrpH